MSLLKFHPLEPLQQIEDQLGSDMPETSKDRIKLLKREFGFFDIFLSLQNLRDRWEMLNVTHVVQSLLQDAVGELKVNVINDVDSVTSQLQDKIWLAKLEIRAEYSFPKVSANKDVIATNIFVMKFIDTVVRSLDDLVMNIDTGVVGNLGDFFKELKLLRNFVRFVSDRCIEPLSHHDFFIHVLLVTGHAAMVVWLYLPGNPNENQESALAEMNVWLYELLRTKIKPVAPDVCKIYIDTLQALRSSIQSQGQSITQIEDVADCGVGFVETLQHNLKEISTTTNPSPMVDWNDQIATLQEMLSLLMASFIHLSIQDLEFHLQDIDIMMVDFGLLVYSLYEDGPLGEVSLDTIQRIKAVIYQITRKEFQSSLPRIHGLGYIDFLLNNLKEFQDRYSGSLALVKTQLQTIQKELESLQPFLKSVVEEQHNNDDKLHHSLSLLIGKAYEVEYIVDACVSNNIPNWCLMLWFLDITKEIGAEVAAIRIPKVDLVSHNTMDTNTSHTLSVLVNTQSVDEGIVGFEDVYKTLKGQLIGGSKERDVISIVGMPGAGKTALANRLFFDESVVLHFDIRAQYTVSSVYSWRGLLLSILAMLPVSIDEASHLSKETNDLAATLRQKLQHGRYLILLDDVWDTGMWTDLEPCLYDANNGSRILLTTRHHDVANNATESSVSKPLHLRGLDDGESWKLLKKKVFGEEFCSPLLEKVGRKIAGKCRGLPLSISYLGCMLRRMEKTEQCWKKVARKLGFGILCYPEDIIEQSYQNLPYHLKSLFLYFGIFSPYLELNLSKLTLLWIGEGFVKDDERRSLEDVAQGYLKSLVESSLVMFAKWSCGGNVKVCRVHDILFHFCKARAQKENFIQRIERYQEDSFSRKKPTQRRLAFYAAIDNLEQWSSSCSLAGSALFKKASANAPSLNAQVFHNFKFLKVLDLELTVIHSFPTELIYLRYFAAQTDHGSVPSSIANMRNLQTLIVTPLGGGELALPATIWVMINLRHLCIANAYFTLSGSQELLENSSECTDLVTLSGPLFSCAEDVEMLSRKSPNLQELRCSFVGLWGTRFPKLDFLTRLEKLKIRGGGGSISGANIFPSHLKSLTLNNFRLGHHESNLAELPSLQVLKLESILFDENNWKVSSGEFPQLEVLKIVNCDHFRHWIVDDDAFCRLKRLVLCECKYLNEIPYCFENLSFLKSIEVKNCNTLVNNSARGILHTRVEEYCDPDFSVSIS